MAEQYEMVSSRKEARKAYIQSNDQPYDTSFDKVHSHNRHKS